MLLTNSEDNPEKFHDECVVGVKELFEVYDEELLPIEDQLQRYKKRDLYSSHFYRTSCKVFGPRKNVRRLHYVDTNPFDVLNPGSSGSQNLPPLAAKIQLPPYYATRGPSSQTLKENHQSRDETEPESEYKSWLHERRKLRAGLNGLGMEASWLARKPNRTCLEDRVLTNLVKSDNLQSQQSKKISSQKIPEIVLPLPSPNSSVHGVLKKTADYLLENKLPLNSLFNNCEASCSVTYRQCKDGLSMLQGDLELSDSDINEVLTHFFRDRKSSRSFYTSLVNIIKRTDPSHVDTSALNRNLPTSLTSSSTITLEDTSKSIGEAKSDATMTVKEARLKEYEEIVKLCEERNVPLTQALLRKVLLHPGDQPHPADADICIRQPGETLSRDFWKVASKRKLRRKVAISNKQPSKESLMTIDSSIEVSSSDSIEKSDLSLKESSDSTANDFHDSAEETIDISSDSLNRSTVSTEVSQDLHCISNTSSYPRLIETSKQCSINDIMEKSLSQNNEAYRKYENQTLQKPKVKQACAPRSSSGIGSFLPSLKSQRPKEFSQKSFNKNRDTLSDVGEKVKSNKLEKTQAVVTFPRLRDVAPERHQMNLSTGRALVGRKVDCWMSFEEFEKITNGSLESPLRRERSIPNAFWPGHLLAKLRLCMSPCDVHKPPACDNTKSKQTIFQRVKTHPHNCRRTNYGYDNNELTWPTDGHYVKYGDIELNKVYHL